MHSNSAAELATSPNHNHDILSHTVYSAVLEMETAVSSRLFVPIYQTTQGSHSIPMFLNCQATAQYRALASIIPGHERPEETTICYKISLVQLITNLNVILYLSTCHTVHVRVLIIFMIMP